MQSHRDARYSISETTLRKERIRLQPPGEWWQARKRGDVGQYGHVAHERESAIVVELPELDAVIDEYRYAVDPSRRWGMPAHLILLYPFVPPASVDHVILSHLVAAARRARQFDAEFDDFGWFADQVVWLAPSHPEQFKGFILRMMDAFPECPPYGSTTGTTTRFRILFSNRADPRRPRPGGRQRPRGARWPGYG